VRSLGRIRAVTFDAGGTLFAPRESVGETYARFAARYGVVLSPADLQKRFERAFRQAPPLCFPGLPAEQIPSAERSWWRELVAAVFAKDQPAAFEALFDDLFTYYASAHAWRVFEDVRPALERLHVRGFALGIVSNFDARLFQICGELGLARYFRSIVVSSRAGAAKPSAEIFRVVLAELGVDPAEALHVGDSWEEDVLGARSAGLHTLWLHRAAEPSEDRIADLRDLGMRLADDADR
jgi:putative hydrolase of the HAD superfamily